MILLHQQNFTKKIQKYYNRKFIEKQKIKKWNLIQYQLKYKKNHYQKIIINVQLYTQKVTIKVQ